MKLAVFDWNNATHLGLVDTDRNEVTRLDAPCGETGIAALIEQALPATAETIPLSEVTLRAPIPRPRRNIFCVGKNYFDHAHEFSSSGFDSSAAQGAVPEHPIVFSKVPESVTGPNQGVKLDASVSEAMDYEIELTVIIGKAGRNIPLDKALTLVTASSTPGARRVRSSTWPTWAAWTGPATAPSTSASRSSSRISSATSNKIAPVEIWLILKLIDSSS